jgi:hypothetical protein
LWAWCRGIDHVAGEDAELVWRLVDVPGNTQEQIAQTMGWNTRVDVARHKALRVLKDAAVWDEVIVPAFQDMGTVDENEEGTSNVPMGTRPPFTERLLREILDLCPGQQLELCRLLAMMAGGTKSGAD